MKINLKAEVEELAFSLVSGQSGVMSYPEASMTLMFFLCGNSVFEENKILLKL